MCILLAAAILSTYIPFHILALTQVPVRNGQEELGNMYYLFDILTFCPHPILHSVQKNGINTILYTSAMSEEQ